MTNCECQNVTRYADVHQCLLCGRKFIPADTVPNELAAALTHRKAQVSIVDGVLIAAMRVSPEEAADLKMAEIGL